MTQHDEQVGGAPWLDRAADRSPAVRRSRTRSVLQARTLIAAARRLVAEKGSSFTTQELAREAGVAVQTFYRHFSGKDELLLAVFEDMIARRAEQLAAATADVDDPVERLRLSITGTVDTLGDPGDREGARFITAEHWRLHQLFPDEMARANQPIADLIERDLRAAARAGTLRPGDPARDAWLVMKLLMSLYHHYAFASAPVATEDVVEHLWSFCLAAFGGRHARVGRRGA